LVRGWDADSLDHFWNALSKFDLEICHQTILSSRRVGEIMNPIKLALTYLRIGVLNEMQYRINFFIQLVQSFVSVATGLIGLSLVFGQVNTLAGWSRPELLAVMGVHLLMGGVIRSIIQPKHGAPDG
jgi:hypothetical protein